MRAQHQELATAVRNLDPRLLQCLVSPHQFEFAVAQEKRAYDFFVLRRQHAARRIHQPSAGFDHARRARQNVALLDRQLGNVLRQLPPFDFRVAPQGAEPAARGIDQYPIHLARQTLDLQIVFIGDAHRVHVREPATL